MVSTIYEGFSTDQLAGSARGVMTLVGSKYQELKDRSKQIDSRINNETTSYNLQANDGLLRDAHRSLDYITENLDKLFAEKVSRFDTFFYALRASDSNQMISLENYIGNWLIHAQDFAKTMIDNAKSKIADLEFSKLSDKFKKLYQPLQGLVFDFDAFIQGLGEQLQDTKNSSTLTARNQPIAFW